MTVVSGLIAGAFVGLVPADAAARGRIAKTDFGVHSYTTDPGVPAGTMRMACWPTWRQIEPRQNQFDWALVDSTFQRVESWGFKDVLVAFCGTPAWAGGAVRQPQYELRSPEFGPGSTAAPKRLADWRDLLTRFVKRYRGRVDSYQAWNEITSPQFYQGSAKTMVAMTRVLNQIVNKYDPSAKVVSASVQTHRPQWFDAMAVPYFRGLKASGWPVDVFSGHFYPAGKIGPDGRIAQIRSFTRTLRRLNAPNRPRWDTEGNFWVGVPGDPPAGRVRGKKAATFVARNYIDTWRTGLQRSYWYLWSSAYVPFAGVQLRQGDAGTRAYRTIVAWTIGAKYRGCKERGRLVVCSFSQGARFKVAFTSRGKAKLAVGRRASICPVTGGKCSTKSGRITVTKLPVRIR